MSGFCQNREESFRKLFSRIDSHYFEYLQKLNYLIENQCEIKFYVVVG